MITKLAYSNIKKSYRIYLVYIFTLTLTIALFYGFGALESSPAIVKLASEEATYTNVFLSIMNVTSYFVSVFVIFLMVYASEFFFKVRSNEYYIYKTLGMSRKKLIELVFCENIFVGVISISFGIILGIIFNQMLSATLINYLKLNESFTVVISISAIIRTIISFIIMLGIISIISATRINKKSIIELKNIKSVITKKKLSKITSCAWMMLGLILLAISYYMGYISQLNPNGSAFYISIFSGFIGTIFTYLGIINYRNTKFRQSEHNKNTLKKAMLYNRLMKNKVSISVISISFVFIMTAIFGSSALIGIFNLDGALVADAEIVSYVPEHYSLDNINLTKYDLANQGGYYQELTYIEDELYVPIVKETQFVNVVENLTNTQITVNNDYEFYIGNDTSVFDENGNNTGKVENSVDKIDNIKIPNNEKLVISENKKVKKIFPHGVLVVADNKITDIVASNSDYIDESYAIDTILLNYNNVTDEEKVINMLKAENTEAYDFVVLTTRNQLLKTSLAFKVSILFTTMYVALFLVIISLAILAIQQVMDAIDNKKEYHKLNILGLNTNDQKKIINTNTNIYFVYPLIMASISSGFALLCVDNFVSKITGTHLLNQNLDKKTLIIIFILVIIYLVYLELVKIIYCKIVGVE